MLRDRDSAVVRHFLASGVVLSACLDLFLVGAWDRVSASSTAVVLANREVPTVDALMMTLASNPLRGLAAVTPFVAVAMIAAALLLASRRGPISGALLAGLALVASVPLAASALAGRPFLEAMAAGSGLAAARDLGASMLRPDHLEGALRWSFQIGTTAFYAAFYVAILLLVANSLRDAFSSVRARISAAA